MKSFRKRVLITGGSGFIGVHLIELLIKENYEVLNIDIKPPTNGTNIDLWKNLSILNEKALRNQFLLFNPHYIVHLGATTTQNATSLLEFEVNIKGTQNVLLLAKELKNLKKFIFTSTQYVNSPGFFCSEDSNVSKPYGFYGESKLIGEKMTQEILQRSNWTIIRPTTIWGPWHPILSDGLWKQIKLNRYFHPSNDHSIKAYGYVKNSAWQIFRILDIENSLTDKEIFYIGDDNFSQEQWVEAFVARLINKKMRRIPKFYLFLLSEFGELLRKIGISFPLYRSRYKNLTTSNPSPLDATISLLGKSPMPFDKALEETCLWLENKK